jgi:energy-coupling factor transporter transmembrane protein EcfT
VLSGSRDQCRPSRVKTIALLPPSLLQYTIITLIVVVIVVSSFLSPSLSSFSSSLYLSGLSCPVRRTWLVLRLVLLVLLLLLLLPGGRFCCWCLKELAGNLSLPKVKKQEEMVGMLLRGQK